MTTQTEKQKNQYKTINNKKRKTFPCFIFVCLVFLCFTSIITYGQKSGKNTSSKAPKGAKGVLQDSILNLKTFTVEMNQEVGKKQQMPFQDDLTFKSDKFKSKVMTTEHKFKSAPYTVTPDTINHPGDLHFESVIENESGEQATWVGTVTETNDISGTVEWVNKKGRTLHMYKFSGTISAIKKKK